MNRKILTVLCIMLLGVFLGTAQAKVTPEEAAKLKGELTPLGAERAGNRDGSIPEWTGGMTNPPPHTNGEWLTDPFRDEKPLFTITTANYKEYIDKLSSAQIAMFENNIQNWKMDIYQTHRTVTVPDWIQENIYRNATSAVLVDDGNGVEGACGGIPFPIPKSGLEVVQNYLLRYYMSNTILDTVGLKGFRNSQGYYSGGDRSVTKVPYYQKDTPCNERLFYFANEYTGVPRRAGEQLVVNDFLNASKRPREAWQYIPGQRRVRRAPTIAFDTPDTSLQTYDDAWCYNGSPEKYDWKLIGKKETFIPYNGYSLESSWGRGELTEANLTPGYPTSPLIMRWELHRTWVVEGTVKENERHIYAKRVFYIDEDSWSIGVHERYDGKGNMWRITFANILYDYGGDKNTLLRPTMSTDLITGEYAVVYLSLTPMLKIDPLPDEYFSPQGLRKRCRR